ncbi:MAG TPA: exodeoxyribonuclease VII large subunit [Gammaproteobacteria bacterium]|nr:exodeoxyribonuclease VII large subunit [Gammaproteobacteria bacterium]
MKEFSYAAGEREVYTVSRLNREAKSVLEGSFPLLWVEGEISNLARPASGHMYFSLKDAQAQIRCAFFRGQQRGLATAPRDGMQVLVRARVSLYEGRGDYQLIVESLEEAGEGALRRAYEQLRARLAEEGLFDPARKKPLPRLPKRIGVITSSSGAVLHDILTTLQRRFPAIPVLLHPVPVQGEGAAEKIAAMLQLAERRQDCDVLILARGGGSLEDLQAFNEELLARAIIACPIPVVCGVGHETDVTIADFVADARAPTPTAAAEMLSPDQHEWLALFGQQHLRLRRLLTDRLRNAQQKIDYLGARLVHPRDRLTRLNERLTALLRHLHAAQRNQFSEARFGLSSLRAQLVQHNPIIRSREYRLRYQHHRTRLAHALQRSLDHSRDQLGRLAHTLETLSPLATLARGYAIVETPKGVVLRTAGQVKPGDPVRARLAQGAIDCRVETVHDET